MLSAVQGAHNACSALCGTRDESGLLVAEQIVALCPEDHSYYAAHVREALCCYVNSRAWMYDPPVPPPLLSDLLDTAAYPIGPIAQQAYSAYYQAMRAYIVASNNYDSYRVWLLILTRGPQPCLPATFGDLQYEGGHFFTFDQHLALGHVRETLSDYLTTLKNLSISLWSLPPVSPPTVPAILRTYRI